MVILQTPDSLDKINGSYKSQLESKGWKVETTVNTDAAYCSNFSSFEPGMIIVSFRSGPFETRADLYARAIG